MKIADEIISFLRRQSYIIFSTVDEEGRPHTVAKGIVDIGEDGVIYLLDLYMGKTYDNLRRNENASVTAIDEHAFIGYTLKGTASILEQDGLEEAVKEKWRKLLRSRITKRIIDNVRSEIGGNPPHEARMPGPKYVIIFQVEEVVNLSHFQSGV